MSEYHLTTRKTKKQVIKHLYFNEYISEKLPNLFIIIIPFNMHGTSLLLIFDFICPCLSISVHTMPVCLHLLLLVFCLPSLRMYCLLRVVLSDGVSLRGYFHTLLFQ